MHGFTPAPCVTVIVGRIMISKNNELGKLLNLENGWVGLSFLNPGLAWDDPVIGQAWVYNLYSSTSCEYSCY